MEKKNDISDVIGGVSHGLKTREKREQKPINITNKTKGCNIAVT